MQTATTRILDIYYDRVNQFRFRVNLYNDWDLRLGHCTRFFGAAAATNALLVKLCTAFRFCVSESTLEFLSAVGETLQCVNLEAAHSIAGGRFHGTDLDESIIVLEQAVLELKLRSLAKVNERMHRLTIRQVDRLLNCLRLGVIPNACKSQNLRLYVNVVRGVAAQLGRPATFEAEFDRVCIGRQLIHQLKEVGARI
jgi:hypothetical protein